MFAISETDCENRKNEEENDVLRGIEKMDRELMNVIFRYEGDF